MKTTRHHERFPDPEQLRELPVQLDCVIPPEWEDRNGHVNVQFYLALFELGGWKVLEEAGVDEVWFRRHAYSFFDLEHHLHYLAEIRVGERVTTYNRVVGRSEKRFHGMYYIVNETRGCLAGTIEYISNGVDMNLRRTASMPEELSRALDRLHAAHQRLSWAPRLCGLMKP
ncbi:MAG: thioesterase family protein [Xanthomonadales bacterium]|jgi:acyl-CoA thioester hydrolase|nr:thioesterase family protein [Xanthomonadales bacterium]